MITVQIHFHTDEQTHVLQMSWRELTVMIRALQMVNDSFLGNMQMFFEHLSAFRHVAGSPDNVTSLVERVCHFVGDRGMVED